jgi:amidase
VPMWPVQDGYITQLGTEGPMGRCVTDVAMLLATQAGYDVRCPLALQDSAFATDLIAMLQDDTLSTHKITARIAWLGNLNGYLQTEPGILEVCEQGLQRLAAQGCLVEPAQLGSDPAAVWQAWLVWRKALVASRIAPLLANPANRALIKPEALWECDQAVGVTAAELMQASVARNSFYLQMVKHFEKYDALALPSAQVWPFDASERWPSHINGVKNDTYHRWMETTLYATFAGLPCISVPVGFNAAGLPMGMQLIGKPRGDVALLQLARQYEAAAGDLLARRPILAQRVFLEPVLLPVTRGGKPVCCVSKRPLTG